MAASPQHTKVADKTERTSGDLDTLSLKILGVTRGLTSPLSELLAVFQLWWQSNSHKTDFVTHCTINY